MLELGVNVKKILLTKEKTNDITMDAEITQYRYIMGIEYFDRMFCRSPA